MDVPLHPDPDRIDPWALPYVAIPNLLQLPPATGIYIVITASRDVIYIGQSVSIRHRLQGHKHRKTFLALESGRIAWLLAPYEALSRLEVAMIDIFKPLLNGNKGGGARPITPANAYDGMTVRFPGDLMAQLRRLAAEEERPINTIILRLVRDALTQKRQQRSVKP